MLVCLQHAKWGFISEPGLHFQPEHAAAARCCCDSQAVYLGHSGFSTCASVLPTMLTQHCPTPGPAGPRQGFVYLPQSPSPFPTSKTSLTSSDIVVISLTPAHAQGRGSWQGILPARKVRKLPAASPRTRMPASGTCPTSTPSLRPTLQPCSPSPAADPELLPSSSSSSSSSSSQVQRPRGQQAEAVWKEIRTEWPSACWSSGGAGTTDPAPLR